MANRLECNDAEGKMMCEQKGCLVSPHKHNDSMAFPTHQRPSRIIVARSG
jgi:hypothetical protein